MTEVEMTISLDAFKRNSKLKHPGMPSKVPVYTHGDVIKGRLSIDITNGIPITHRGISISIIGMYTGRKASSNDVFYRKSLQLLPPSNLTQSIKCPFSFDRISLPECTYMGQDMNIEYFVECCISKLGNDLSKKAPFYYIRLMEIKPVPLLKGIGISNVLHMDIIIQSTKIDPRGAFIGILYFALFKLRIVSVSFDVVRREKYKETFYNVFEDQNLVSYELLDGAPVKGCSVPIRIYIGHLNLWPAPINKEAKVTADYFLRVLAIDENGGHYVKLLPVEYAFEKPAA